tara:strand:+ start:20464 stop:22278 length:1815 start_codon:yes stop_codon:yes gene_type:complete
MNLEQLVPDIATLQRGYRAGEFSPAEVIDTLLARAEAYLDHNIFITRLERAQIELYLSALSEHAATELPLYGIPFLIKDNIDLAGIATTAGCRQFAHVPHESAFIVQHLLAAGAIPLGKTNMDQFATGLVGTRSPDFGVCGNSLNPEWISGGSSSGSAVGVALGLASFSLGTDTAGSGRVPAMLNNLYGLKPSRGLLGMSGVLPACRSLDCPSIFALTAIDARRVFEVLAVRDPGDPYARQNPFANTPRGAGMPGAPLRFGVPRAEQREFYGNSANAALYAETLARWEDLGAQLTEVDIAPLLAAAKLLYEGPWVAERYAALREFIEEHADAMDPVVRGIVEPARAIGAVDQWQAEYRMQAFRAAAAQMFAELDALILPTAPTIYSIAELLAEPVVLNANMGRYTNFMNLLDLCGVAVPAGFNSEGQPFGVTLVGPAMCDQALLGCAEHWQASMDHPVGALGRSVAVPDPQAAALHAHIEVAVCGAHLDGMPLNWQLRERGGRLQLATHTSPHYRLYALGGGPPRRPGLVRDSSGGGMIEVEVWSVPAAEFGSFVAGIPAPLGIGKLELEDGRWLSGFLCEPYGLEGATEITVLGGWRKYIETA